MTISKLLSQLFAVFALLFSVLSVAGERDVQAVYSPAQQQQLSEFSEQSLQLQETFKALQGTAQLPSQVLSVWLRYQEQLPELAAQLQALLPEKTFKNVKHGWQKQRLAFAKPWQQYQGLLMQRKQMLQVLPEAYRYSMYRLGPEGIAQLQLEGKLLALHSAYATWRIKGFALDFISAQKASLVSSLVAILQLGFAALMLLLWRKKIVTWCEKTAKTSVLGGFKHKAFNVFIMARKPFETAFLAYAFLATLQSFLRLPLDNIAFVQLYSLVLLVLGLRVLWLLSQGYSELFVKSLKSSFRFVLLLWFGLSVVQIIVQTLAINHWLSVGLIKSWQLPASFLVFAGFIVIWRPYWLMQIDSKEFSGNRLKALPKHWRQGFKSYLLVLAALVYLGGIRLLRFFLRITADSPTVNLWLAYLFRMEVVRQNASMQNDPRFSLLPESRTKAFLPSFDSEFFNNEVNKPLQEKIENLVLANKASIALVHGPRGAGKSSFIKTLQGSTTLQEENVQVLAVSCPTGGFSQLLEQLGLHLMFDENIERQEVSSARELISALKDMGPTLICIDDLQHLVSPKIGGLDELERLMRLMRRASAQISWLLVLDTASWRFVERARGERFIFDAETMLNPWPEKAISELILARTEEAGLQVDVSQLHLPKQLSQKRKLGQNDVMLRFSVIIWEYAKGNPAVALWLWSTALFLKQDEPESTVYLRLFDTRDNEDLVHLSVNLLLVLRAIMQMSKASKDELASSVNLSSDEVVDALRLLRSKGFIIRNDNNEYEIHWPDYRAISLLLERQHLLAI